MYALLAAALITPDVERLGSPVYGRREFAELRLRILGPLAWPALDAAARSEDPEVRRRAERLLRPRRQLDWFLRAANVLLADEPPKPWAFFSDEELRYRVLSLCRGCGVSGYTTRALDPAEDCWRWWEPAWLSCDVALRECRAFFRGGTPVPEQMPGP